MYLVIGWASLTTAQEKKTVYLFFDATNPETCQVVKDGGGYLNQKKYQKINSIQSEYKYRFYICKELFLLERNKKIDTCSVEHLKNIYFSKLEDLKKMVDKENPLYPWKVFKKVYIVEKINAKQLVKYEVKWQYYIE